MLKAAPSRSTAQLLNLLTEVGLIRHYERVASTKGRIKVYLRYRNARPLINVRLLQTRGKGAVFVSLQCLKNYVNKSGGSVVFISTKHGVLTHFNCLKYKTGGYVVAVAQGV